jgi:hypothetical protein
MASRRALPRSIRQSISNQTKNLLVTGRRFDRFDRLRQRHFWSTLRVSPNANGYIPSGSRQIYTTPPGQVGQGFLTPLTERDTNWKSANRVPDNQNFEITEIGVSVGLVNVETNYIDPNNDILLDPSPDALTNALWFNRIQALTNTVVEITYLTNAVPLGMCNDFAQSSGTTAGDFAIASKGTNGFAAPALRRRFKIPILLQHGETFAFQLTNPRTYCPFVGPDYVAANPTMQLEFRFDFWATESFVEKS